MAEASPQATSDGDRRSNDRRRRDRRSGDRRTPVPLWRRPWAYVAYGLVGALLLVLAVNLFQDEPENPLLSGELTQAGPAVRPATTRPVQSGNLPEDARGVADYERLIAEGEAAGGRLVRTTLFCEAISPVSLRLVDQTEAEIAQLAAGTDRVPAAQCKWGEAGADLRQENFLLLVPPAMAEQFASLPVVEDGFVTRRRVPAVVEWIGRSEALSLRIAGLLRQIAS